MAAAVSVLVPWRPDGAERDQAWEHVQGWWQEHHPAWQVVTGSCPDGPWRKALAVADALKYSEGDVLVVGDADVICPEVTAAVDHVTAGRAPWAIPHSLVYRLTTEATQRVYDGEALQPDQAPTDLTRPPYRGVEGGGLVVLPRSTYERVPLDPRFATWGQDDEAWALALTTLAGAPWRGTAPLWHLWHQPAPRQTQRIGNRAGWDLYLRYKQAARLGTRTMERLVAEYVAWDGRAMDFLGPGWDDTSAPAYRGGQIGETPVKFVSEKYPDLHIPTIGVRFRDGEAEVTTRGAIAYLRSPWMRRRGVKLASEAQEEPATPTIDVAPAPLQVRTSGGEQSASNGSEPTQPEPGLKAASPDSTAVREDGITSVGGGWHEIVVGGEVVGKVRGKEAAQEHLQTLTGSTA